MSPSKVAITVQAAAASAGLPTSMHAFLEMISGNSSVRSAESKSINAKLRSRSGGKSTDRRAHSGNDSSASMKVEKAQLPGERLEERTTLPALHSPSLRGSARPQAAVCAASRSLPEPENFREDLKDKLVTPSKLDATCVETAKSVASWSGQFSFVTTLQDAVRNHGRVDLMTSVEDQSQKFAVKRMPTRWFRKTATDFQQSYPNASERPWVDVAIIRLLSKRDFKYVNQLHGIFQDSEHTYVVSTFCSSGDLFSWCDQDPKPGRAREEMVLPVMAQVFSAVRFIHDVGIAHRDLSLENILLTGEGSRKTIKLIDFGMATLSRSCRKEVRGKQSYQAPEMHNTQVDYDPFLADAFSVGVILFALSAQDYPWVTTKRNQCQLFEYVSVFGFRAFLQRRKLRTGRDAHLSQVLSEPLVDVLIGLLDFNSQDRTGLGESCWPIDEDGKTRASVWDSAWIVQGDVAHVKDMVV